MATFGLDETGFTLKRLEDILQESRANAQLIFQDLVGPTDFIDTSDSSTIGRFINLFSLSDTILWEQAQLSYSALDPNTAIGVALDNIVQYGGVQRFPASYSTATALFKGTNGTVIPIDSLIGSTLADNTFAVTSPVTLTPTLASGVVIVANNIVNNALFTIKYSVGETINTISYTSDSSATALEITSGLKTVIDSAHPLLKATLVGEKLDIQKVDLFQAGSFTANTNTSMNIQSVYKLGVVRSSAVGPLSAELGTLNTIKTPVLGWESVINPVAANLGSFIETDEELRLRFRETKFERSSNILDSIYSALKNLPEVESVAVYENDTDTVDSNGLPPHSFTAVVSGGESEEIANTIWKNKPVGITSNGNTSVEILDSQGFPRNINFERPTPIPIYVTMELDINAEFPADGVTLIRNAIVEYARENFSVGEDIIYSRLYTPINSVNGHQVTSLFIGTSPSPAGITNIPIDFDQVGSFESVNITITTV